MLEINNKIELNYLIDNFKELYEKIIENLNLLI